MDKYEYKLKLDQMKASAAAGDYGTAAEIADTINWRKIKNVNLLMRAGEIYTKQKRYEEARDILLMAYDRSPIGRMIIYRLAEIAIKMKNFDEAQEYYDEFVELAPRDNLRYVLRYKICKAKGTDLKTQIAILEEYKELEYSEEWAYELAFLYHKAGEGEKCVDACDDLILWFGEGIYVERAMEMKMLYQPLTKSQEEKYRTFKEHRDDAEKAHSGKKPGIEIVAVSDDAEKFNTKNLEKELKKSMDQIKAATEQEAVDDTMDNIKKLVEKVPYLKLPEEKEQEIQEAYEQAEQEIDSSLPTNYKELLAEEYGGQLSMLVKNDAREPQVNGQLSIQDLLSDWEKSQRAAQVALQMVEQKKLENAKAKALKEAGDIMDRLSDVMPAFEEGATSAQLIRKEYLTDGNVSDEEEAGKFMEGVNTVLQQEIDRLQEEKETEEKESELLRKIKQAKPNLEEKIGFRQYTQQPIPQETEVSTEMEDAFAEEPVQQETSVRQETTPLPEIAMPDDISSELLGQDTKEIKTRQISEALSHQMQDYEQTGEELVAGERLVIKKLSDEQKEIFSYFVPVDGMEKQLCQVLTGASARLSGSSNSATGNILIQGGVGCGKTVLATGIIKALQKEVKRPNGKIGKIDAKALNKKDLSQLLKKVAGGCLIIERAGEINRETAVKLSLLLESDTSGILVIMEDTRAGLNQALGRDEGLAKKFTEKITIPVFTSDELVEFGKKYANDLDYEIDNMGVLALYNRISTIQRLDRATTLTEVKEIVDQAIEKAEKKSLKKAFSILTSRRYAENDYVILHEKDFEE